MKKSHKKEDPIGVEVSEVKKAINREVKKTKKLISEEQEQVIEYIQNNPLKSVAIAFLVGYLLGRSKR